MLQINDPTLKQPKPKKTSQAPNKAYRFQQY